MPKLSTRERQLLELLSQGYTVKLIGRHCQLSCHTVSSYLSRIYAKLGASNAAHAVALGISYGYIERLEC